MANLNLLRAKMAEAGCINFINEIAADLKISRGAASLKMNNKSPFKQAEIAILANKYNMTPEDIKKIFVNE